jgi:flagellar hook-basal body complex protein FliE
MSPSVDPVAAIGQALVGASQPEAASPSTGMADAFGQLIDQTNAKINAADLEVRKLAVGKADSLHGVMIAIESAKESLSLVVQVRNRLVDAYQDVLRMQI